MTVGKIGRGRAKPKAQPAPPLPPVLVSAQVDHEQLLSALPHPIVVLGGDDRVAYVNGPGEQFFSMSETMLRRMTLAELVGSSSPLLALVGQVRRTGATVNEYGVEASLPRMHAMRLVDVYGGPLADQGTGPDVGQVLLMLQQRSMAQMIERQLTHRAAARSVSGLAAVLAHEIKNPLSGIRGAAQLLEPALSADDRALAQLICSETDRIRDLVDRMEVFGDERPFEKSAVNIHAVLDHVRRLSESGFGRGLRIIEDYDPSLPMIPAHRDKLVQAFLNLVKNAVEAVAERSAGGSARDGGRIVMRTGFRPGVRLAVPGAKARVSLPFMVEIEDNGSGVPDSIRGQLFDPFVTTKHTGTGLGLALVAKMIGDHGGVIECDSQPGRTVFRVLLPVGDVSGLAGRLGDEAGT